MAVLIPLTTTKLRYKLRETIQENKAILLLEGRLYFCIKRW
jgi:hypothetical protein